jgi:hypothetical protein
LNILDVRFVRRLNLVDTRLKGSQKKVVKVSTGLIGWLNQGKRPIKDSEAGNYRRETHPKAFDDPGLLLMEGTAWGKGGKTTAFCLYITW